VLTASPAPFGNSQLVLLPWSRVAHAVLSALQYKLTVELEGVPPHVWREDTAAKLLAPYCWIQEVEPVTAVGDDLSAFKLTAWTKNPSCLPRIIWLSVAEPPPGAPAGEGFRFQGTRPFLSKKDVLRYKIIVHLRCVRDYETPTGDDSSSSSDDPVEDGRGRRRHHGTRSAGVGIHPYPCRRGVPDGAPPANNGGGGGRQRTNAQGPSDSEGGPERKCQECRCTNGLARARTPYVTMVKKEGAGSSSRAGSGGQSKLPAKPKQQSHSSKQLCSLTKAPATPVRMPTVRFSLTPLPQKRKRRTAACSRRLWDRQNKTSMGNRLQATLTA
jgi:hypothetical protein